jgi:signal transduction histidine kinase
MSSTKPRILLIEDDTDQAFVLRYFLKNSGYAVDWCSKPDSCLKSAKSNAYDLILLDINLSADIDGFELIRRFKADPLLQPIPVMMVTARTKVQDRVSGLNLGADDYITKPFNQAELASRIKTVLKRKIYLDLANRYRELLENNRDLVLFLNKKGQIEHVNKRAESVLPHLIATERQLDFIDLFDEEFHDPVSSTLYNALNGKDVSPKVWRLRDTGEHQVMVEVQLTPLRHSDQVIGLGCTLKDPSMHEQKFKKLEQTTHGLLEKIKNQNAQLDEIQQKLVMSEKLAVMGQLAAGVAHEFRNPLNSISLSVQFLKMISKSEKPKFHEHLDMIEQEVKRSQKIIDNLLKFAKKSPAKERLDIRMILDQTLTLIAKPLKLHNVEIKKSYNHFNLVYVNADDMKQVFLNLFLNAIDAMPRGGLVSVQTREDKESVRVKISDTGPGISKSDQQKIFEPFFTRKETGSGVGLGLSIVHSAIDRNKGSIEVDSEPGLGTTFNIYLPVQEHHEPGDFIT